MGQKISPTSLRVGINKDWASRWFGGRKYQNYLEDDLKVRSFLEKKLKNMGIDRIELERGTDLLNVVIFTSRPGFLIGRGGTGVEELKAQIKDVLKRKISIRLEIQEIKNPESSAKVMAESMVEQVEKRIPYRRILKQTLAKIISNRQVKGAKLMIGGRLDGSEIARSEHLEEGSLPLQTIRADIDFARSTAITTYGTVGVKVWIYKGEVFDK
ncbi:MAG: 30S ribosomal protein S3 [Candidatus Yanofskybacteria bacterium RIFCSPHIGHO2_02_FULL_41_29]|uniref:Small ribosomal subunit protein uS3 n=1 Tax=Candidatus Yanofskybacteria bacterium RIFCSPHIGHO2_01_FULL_41_53 TaxID=1802663 RepID=A0A1F8EHN5_9BACT|nr:MAG: 30S ribosomal protein S3 [Candidatus Yanofskybacteria bacterium RIFCSPHIGHO2_01_FULL_41_53]OGN11595.1 MAG: 30S ribosomal protein S3 [Candidatus Yanofskybacteria bacterium RIFCSPHIGHO2_02_FULL_41_29]OGN18185.1 MAG: 30S ribosomal protein S3 [Candidatus Yanofskybacteria bacterium RIFCSPHIGHO2_12_FULL_41_9]OGN22832.1 MAG: 30S ribosomal protein S3 [Candidatus Yanofskybacteria bacterium RIFCSPLOWO2_01_FULL_41_67]OGN30099.1 MAG: 30S ribosomal protein S3 [Candidatus Yanofskybacteria bacterium R